MGRTGFTLTSTVFSAPSSRKIFVLMALPALVAVLVYLNTLGADFVFDDNHQILENPLVKELRYVPRLLTSPVWAFKTTEPTNYYRPVQMSFYNLLWSISSGKPWLFHLANVIFHAMTASLLAAFVYRLSRDIFVAGTTALVFAVHPVNTEAVAWIACLPELTYSFFAIVALILHVSAWPPGAKHISSRKMLALLAGALAMFSKETALILVGLVFLLELWVRPKYTGEIQHASSASPWWIFFTNRTALKLAARATLPYFLTAAGYLIARWFIVGGIAPKVRGGLTAADAIINAPSLLLSYLRVMVLPTKLIALHTLKPLPSIAHPGFVFALLAVVLLAGLVIILSRWRPDLAFACSLACLPLLPVLYIPAIGSYAFAERYAYLPSAGIVWLCVGGLMLAAKHVSRTKLIQAMMIAMLLLVVASFSFMSVRRNRDWRNDKSLAIDTLRDEPKATFMYVVLGNWYDRNREPVKALEIYEQGFRADPWSYFLQTAVVTQKLGLHRISPEEAVMEFRRLTEKYPGFYAVWSNLGTALIKAKKLAEAEVAFRHAIELNPYDLSAYDGLKLSMIAQGSDHVGKLSPPTTSESVSSKANEKRLQGISHAKAGRLEKAEEALREALQLEPNSERTLCMLGVVRAKRGDDRAAIEYCRRAVAIKPDFVEAYQQIGVSAMRLGDLDQAIRALEKAVSIAPEDKHSHEKLGRAYVLAHRLEDARRSWERALEIDPNFEQVRQSLKLLDQAK